MFLLPQNIYVEAEALSDCTLVSCCIGRDMTMYNRLFTQLCIYLPQNHRYNYCPLQISSVISDYFNLLVKSLKEEITNVYYHQIKREELFIYLHRFYSKNLLAQFFYPVLSTVPKFRDFVTLNFRKYNNLSNFAEAANMSLSTFCRKFKKEFGMPALRWINLHKAEDVYNDLIDSDLTLTDLADKYGFSSTSYLTTFCKKYLGKLPHEIRVRVKQS